MKSCHLSKDDVRILDMDTGKVVLVSHHPGKNPYETLDPLDLGNTGNQHAVQGGEWESVSSTELVHLSMYINNVTHRFPYSHVMLPLGIIQCQASRFVQNHFLGMVDSTLRKCMVRSL